MGKGIFHCYRKVTEEDIQKYCEEFIDTLGSFIKGGYILNPEWAVSECGVVVRFLASRKMKSLQYNENLETLDEIMKELRIKSKNLLLYLC